MTLRTFALGLIAAVLWANGAEAWAESCRARTILVIHSYAPDYSWTEAQNQGIIAALARHPCPPHVRIEYLDAKFVQADAYFTELAEILASKYRGSHLDGVITTDNAAFDFVQSHGAAIFGDVPTVSGGINAYNQTPPRPPVVAALPETADHLGTLRQALDQNPKAREVYAVADTTITGRAVIAEIRHDLALSQLPLALHAIENLPMAEIEARLAALPRDAIVYIVPFFRDAIGQAFSEGAATRRLAQVSRAPIYSSWASEIGHGAVGGRTISGHNLGAEAASALSHWLDGGAYTMPPSTHPPYQNIYDAEALARFGIPAKRVPEDAHLLNRTPSLWEQHKSVIIPAAGVIALLAALLGLAVQTLRSQRVINLSNRRILAMNREVIETQREVVATLGEVIEARSLETANHVRRVAAISRFLGEKLGLAEEDLDILEGASPLHDVGKIGIPEDILAKPGRLTSEEFEIIKTHTTIGQRILKNSTRTLMHAACTIAHQHHERWDGKGYPRGLMGTEIDIMARITMLADVFDALLSERCYKPAWPEAEALALVRKERGAMFDPALVDILVDHVAEVRAIREALADDTAHRLRLQETRASAAAHGTQNH